MAASRRIDRPADTATGSPTAPVPSPTLYNNVNPTAASLGQDTSPPTRDSTRVENSTTRRLRKRGLIA
jgi:hypothetical protein